MDYEWDVFLSYKRHAEWPAWIMKHFLPLVEQWLSEDLGEPARIYWDHRDLEVGSDYPLEMADALARSRVLLPLFSKMYVRSPWCRTELGLMRARETTCGYRTVDNLRVLIVGARLHGEDSDFADDIRRMQAALLSAYTNPRMAYEKSGDLSDAIKTLLSPPLAKAVENAPPFDAGWKAMAAEAMDHAFEGTPARQAVPPGLVAA